MCPLRWSRYLSRSVKCPSSVHAVCAGRWQNPCSGWQGICETKVCAICLYLCRALSWCAQPTPLLAGITDRGRYPTFPEIPTTNRSDDIPLQHACSSLQQCKPSPSRCPTRQKLPTSVKTRASPALSGHVRVWAMCLYQPIVGLSLVMRETAYTHDGCLPSQLDRLHARPPQDRGWAAMKSVKYEPSWTRWA